tara:strand:- start:928 stop:1350 length:423 start_codon:yes stop_codon:yes gene_type:complete
MRQLDKILVHPLKEINLADGDVLHALKQSDQGYKNFGEVYFSKIKFNAVKAWKFHKKMSLNLVVPIGNVKFVFFDEHESKFREIIIGQTNYKRIFVPPKIWFGFKGLDENVNLIMNVADIEHDPDEVRKEDVNKFEYTWL